MADVSPQNKRKHLDDNEENTTPVSKQNKKKKTTKESNTPKAQKASKKSVVALKPECTESKPETLKPIQNNLKQTKLSFFKVPKDNENWSIQDFLFDKEWKTLLQDEFEKEYFISINEAIKPGYKKDIVRPPKELVFNALNSTKIKDIKVVIIGQDPYHDDNQVFHAEF